MATDTLSTSPDSAKLDDIAETIQIQASRIKSLVEAIDSENMAAGIGGHVLNYASLIREAAERARAAGEELEILSLQSKADRPRGRRSAATAT